jgi:hypothetical protein
VADFAIVWDDDYKRGIGSFSIASMEPVRDYEHLKELIATPYRKLPSKARGPVRR